MAFCASCGAVMADSAGFCTKCGKPSAGSSGSGKFTKVMKLEDFMEKKAKSRLKFSNVKKQTKRVKCVLAWHKKMKNGSTVCADANENADYDTLMQLCFTKMTLFNSHLMPGKDMDMYQLLFRNMECARTVPGTAQPFTLARYKEAIGIAYSHLTFVLNYCAGDESSEEDGQNELDKDDVISVHSSSSSLPDFGLAESVHPDPAILTDVTCRDSLESHCVGEQQSVVNFNFPVFDDEERDLQIALELSSTQAFPEKKPLEDRDEIRGIIKAFSDTVVKGPVRRIVVDRRNVWKSAFMNWKLPTISGKHGEILVKFTGELMNEEPSADAGGPRREFFTYFIKDLTCSSGMFSTDSEDRLHLRSNIKCAQEGAYRIAGEIIATMVAQGGPPPQMFNEVIVRYMMVSSVDQLSLDVDFADPITKEALTKILTAEKQQDLIVDSLEIVDGLPTLTLDNKQQFVDLYLKASFLSIKPYLDELMIGLNHYGFLDMVRLNGIRGILSQSMKPAMSVTAQDVLKLLKVVNHNSQKQRELETIILSNMESFLLMLEDNTVAENLKDQQLVIDGKECEVNHHESLLSTLTKLQPVDVIAFVTGARMEPAAGWPRRPVINFDHNAVSSYATASTCALTLTLPATEDNKDLMKFLFTFTVSLMHGGSFSAI